ncbi:MAG: hypothetical protein UHO61_03810 [Acutalibacteraceae bacterium]|nr:hypothetical protein [Acutalibacteraceae bacterium]
MVNSGVFAQMFEEAGINGEDLAIFAGIMVVYFAFLGVISLVMYLLNAFGLYGMAKGSGISAPWRGFIPFANTFLFGKIAERYVKKDGKKSAKFGGLLLAFEILTLVFAAAVVVFSIGMLAVLFGCINNAGEIETAIGYTLIPMFFSALALMGVSITYIVLYYVALWRIFTAFDYNNATLYFVLTIFFSFLGPIFLFVLRNKKPVFDTREHFKYYFNDTQQ